MSTLKSFVSRCGVCGQEGDYDIVASAMLDNDLKLDGNPGEYALDTMRCFKMICKHCGYVSDDIERVPKDFTKDKMKAVYNKIDGFYKPKIAYYLKLSHAYEMEDPASFHSLIEGAWMADLLADELASKKIKATVFSLFSEIPDFRKVEEEIFWIAAIDFGRRLGFFNETLKNIEEGLKLFTDETLLKVLRFQKKLCQKRILSEYSLKRALN